MLKRFASYYKPHMKLFIIDLICAFLISGIDLIFPVMTREILNNVIPNQDMNRLYMMAFIMCLLYGIRAFFDYIVAYWGHVVGVRMEYDMRKDIFSHMQKLSFSYFDKNKTGKIMSRIINDLRDITELAHHGPEDLFTSLVMLIGSFIILMGIEWRLTLIIFSLIPVIIFIAIKKRSQLNESFMEQRKKIADVNAQLENTISGIRVVQSFTNEELEKTKFDVGNTKFKNSRESVFKIMGEYVVSIQFITNFLNVIVISFGGYFVYHNFITMGDLVAYLLYVGFFLQPIRRLVQFTQQFESGMTGFKRFVEIMEIDPEIKDKEDAVKIKDIVGDVEFKNVSFAYNNKEEVLSNISMKIENGKTVALVGPSGGGKTTLCHLIPRFYEITSGSITVDGVDIQDIKLRSLRENIGIVQQNVFLFTGTVRENIVYGNSEATENEIIEAAKKANIHEFIESLPDGYDTYVGEKGVQLSGGQKQRMSIARVFLKNPKILILDEATSALDNETEIKIQQSLESLSKGRTTIVIAHRLSTIKNADEIVVLTEEGISEKGSHEELMIKNGIYKRLYNSQFKGFLLDEIKDVEGAQ